MPACDDPRDSGERCAVDRNVAEVDEAHPDLRGERRDELGLGEDPLVDEHAAEAAPEAALLQDRGVELVLRDQTTLDEDVAQLLHGDPLSGFGGDGA